MNRETDDLFRMARAAGQPTPADLKRTRRRINARLAALGVASATALATKKAAAGGSTVPKVIGVSLAVKVAGGLGVAAALTVLGVSLMAHRQEQPRSAPLSYQRRRQARRQKFR